MRAVMQNPYSTPSRWTAVTTRGPDTILVRLDDHGIIRIEVRADRIPHMRAALNSVLRLAQAAEDTLRSTSGRNGGRPRRRPPEIARGRIRAGRARAEPCGLAKWQYFVARYNAGWPGAHGSHSAAGTPGLECCRRPAFCRIFLCEFGSCSPRYARPRPGRRLCAFPSIPEIFAGAARAAGSLSAQRGRPPQITDGRAWQHDVSLRCNGAQRGQKISHIMAGRRAAPPRKILNNTSGDLYCALFMIPDAGRMPYAAMLLAAALGAMASGAAAQEDVFPQRYVSYDQYHVALTQISDRPYVVIANFGERGVQMVDVMRPYNPVTVSVVFDGRDGFEALGRPQIGGCRRDRRRRIRGGGKR